MKSEKNNPFDLNVEPVKISKFRIDPLVLETLAERRRKKKNLSANF